MSDPDIEQTVSLLRATLDSTADGILVVDRAGRVTASNRTFAELSGLPEASLAASDDRRLLEHVLGLMVDPDAFLAKVREVYETPNATSFDEIALHDGRIFERYSQPQIVRGEPIGRVWSFRDITARRTAQAALAASERSLAEAQRIASIGSWRANLDTMTVKSSAEHLAIDGLPDLGAPRPVSVFRDACHADDRARVEALFDAAIAKGEPAGAIFRITSADGSVRVVDVRVNFLKQGARVVEMVGTTQDITERQQLNDQLAAADRMATIGSLAAGVAHEINNPLAALIGNVDLLAEDLGTGGYPKHIGVMLADIRDAAERIRLIARDLRLFARGGDEPMGAVEVERVLDSSLRLAANELRHRARVVRSYRQVPPVLGHQARLGQVFLNLIINAAQAIKEGHVEQNAVTLATRVDDDRVVVEVRDTGEGIAPERLADLFRPFHSSKPAAQGMGLGLTICKRIVAEHGGRITVESAVGRGTTFTISLPAAVEVPAAPIESASIEPARPRRAAVLVVDDDPLVGKVIRRILAEHEVTVTTNAADALRRLRDGQRYDVILSDVMMPHMTGMEFHELLRAMDPDQVSRMVFMTGGAFTPAAQRFLESVALPCLEKPIDVRTLRATIERALGPAS